MLTYVIYIKKKKVTLMKYIIQVTDSELCWTGFLKPKTHEFLLNHNKLTSFC